MAAFRPKHARNPFRKPIIAGTRGLNLAACNCHTLELCQCPHHNPAGYVIDGAKHYGTPEPTPEYARMVAAAVLAGER